ncbi:MAG: translocation protein TolB, partial [Bryobacteraceae bacterium]
LPFYNQKASVNPQVSFTPDGKQVIFASTASVDYLQIYGANLDGSNIRRLTHVRAVEAEPKVNPKTGSEIVFVSGRGGTPQIYKMNIDGGDIVRLTTGEGDAVNPSWHPDGKHIAFSWTRGFEPGNFNIFVMDVATRQVAQLTHGMGRNENPVWAPDGLHIVYSSKRGRTSQVFTMLADGTQQQQLTTQGNNTQPVWGKGISQ